MKTICHALFALSALLIASCSKQTSDIIEWSTNGVTGVRMPLHVSKLPKTGWRIYASLISAMVAGRLVWGLVKFLLAGLQGTEFSLALFLSGAVTTAIPGIILQLILIPILVVVMERTNMALDV